MAELLMRRDGIDGGIVLLGVMIGLIVAAIIGIVLVDNAKATQVDRCPNQPEILKTAKGAKQRAHKAWNHRTLKKDQGAIERVRIQARCVPSKKGRAHVQHHIDEARSDYQKAKKKAQIRELYRRLTAAPGQARLAVLRQCESTNRYNSPAAPAGAYGMLQGWALSGTYFASDKRAVKWQRLTGDGPTSPPYMASPDEQDIRASLLYQHHGTSPWECPF